MRSLYHSAEWLRGEKLQFDLDRNLQESQGKWDGGCVGRERSEPSSRNAVTFLVLWQDKAWE